MTLATGTRLGTYEVTGSIGVLCRSRFEELKARVPATR
jgi:hypothetical protein